MYHMTCELHCDWECLQEKEAFALVVLAHLQILLLPYAMRILLVVTYFTKVENLTLNNTARTCPLVFDYVPVPMVLTIFKSFVAS